MRKLALSVLLGVYAVLSAVALPNGRPVRTNGFTGWDCRLPHPNGWVRHDLVIDSPDVALVVAYHEDVHTEQMERHESCEAYKAAWNDSLWLDMEAEAFYEQAIRAVELGLFPDMVAAVKKYGTDLSLAYPFDITPTEGQARIWLESLKE